MGKLSSEELEKHKHISTEFKSEFNEIPKIHTDIYAKKYQYEMISVMHYLLGSGLAKTSGNNYGSDEEIPLFDHNNDKGKPVNSISWARGIKLLKGQPKLLHYNGKVEDLMRWIVQEFSIIKRLAMKTYGSSVKLNNKNHLVHIIAGAAHCICNSSIDDIALGEPSEEEIEKSDFISRMSRKEKILFLFSSFVLSVALVVFYYTYPRIIHFGLAGLLFLSALLSIIALIIIKIKNQSIPFSEKRSKFKRRNKSGAKRLMSGLSTVALYVFLAAYQLFLLTLLTPHERQEAPYVIFIAVLLTFLINIFCGYQALHQITYALTISNRNSHAHFYFSHLNKYKKNINPIADIIPLLFFASITLVALANMPSLWEAYMNFGAR